MQGSYLFTLHLLSISKDCLITKAVFRQSLPAYLTVPFMTLIEPRFTAELMAVCMEQRTPMTNTCPSVTAWRVARHRAKHQIADHAAVFSDPLALTISGEDTEILATEGDTEGEKSLRLFMAIRSRMAEDKLAQAILRGVRQAVVMGGGLDTLGLRNPHEKSGLSLFEVDHPAMQAWKQKHMAHKGLGIPPSLTFVPVDFEQDSLRASLAKAGFDLAQPAFFSWLGVVPYLTQDAIEKTLRFVASIPKSEIVFDYGEPIGNYEGPHSQPTCDGCFLNARRCSRAIDLPRRTLKTGRLTALDAEISQKGCTSG